jgi:hypothetical protein
VGPASPPESSRIERSAKMYQICAGIFLLAFIVRIGLMWTTKSYLDREQLLAYALLAVLLLYPLVYCFVQAHARYVYPIQWALYLLSSQSFVLAFQRWNARSGKTPKLGEGIAA